MTWVLLLLELVPALIKIVSAIVQLIQKLKTRPERTAARRELRGLARAHVRRLRTPDTAFAEDGAVKDLVALKERLEVATKAA